MSSTSRVLLGLAAGLAVGITLAAFEHPSLPGLITLVEPLGVLLQGNVDGSVTPVPSPDDLGAA